MSEIVLSTFNARYSHASLGLRYLRANLGELRERSEIVEFVIGLNAAEVAERLLAHAPRIIGLGVYVWNVEECERLVTVLKRIAPEVIVVLGGPEVSFSGDAPGWATQADYIVTGWGEVSFRQLAQQLLAGERPTAQWIAGLQPPLAEIAWPYEEYSDRDIAQRNLYLEASRGCPFKCEFCLSALDKTAWPFPLDGFLEQIERLWQRGARRFKFVDRTFNLKLDASVRILGFFLDKLAAHPDDPPFAHFELVPDHLPEALKDAITRFPPGCLQFEIGIQTFNAVTQALISRKQDNAKAEANLRWLREHSHAHLHVDLIAGLPGEDLASFADGFDRLCALAPHEIQLGILKRLRGAPIDRHTQPYGMRYDPHPPYALLANDAIVFADMQRFSRFARYWDQVANSGRFAAQLPALLSDQPFARFMAFSGWLHAQLDATGRVAPERLAALLARWLQGDAAAPRAADHQPMPITPVTPPRQRRHSAPSPLQPNCHRGDTTA